MRSDQTFLIIIFKSITFVTNQMQNLPQKEQNHKNARVTNEQSTLKTS